ncbi:putative vacuolar protein sorting-associated protein 26 [Toxoplasma gondii VAND]|uniref:Putative vacuolar protein sorting-associated protein 26 n=4 Tax=Toxoplasma gondii TaxID=5811 RepID=A0A2G8YE78_TOXGO|nr:putative vacuolar protein sorting-associated protein 26 [Toxoplasma gondii FOU]KFH04478.1 putative vacuolar protein sorting-associated protein 26 [Toxoplasma gondii MAS]KFH10260.1 putative vacuolar protein sorting-associated protein 26 [Toxoplasma gondii VAND]PIM05577.1 putative vacuolar protein sorting-associated protein 26 [Toxoplasma gondii COUG]PUA89926.1 putative vacuolar protein sorting-associated protein 26 [Toxoplasma gondii TgCATBr9]
MSSKVQSRDPELSVLSTDECFFNDEDCSSPSEECNLCAKFCEEKRRREERLSELTAPGGSAGELFFRVSGDKMLATLFGSVCTVEIFIDQEGRKTTYLSRDKKGERVPIFSDGEDVTGCAILNLKPGKRLDHNGIKVELIGQIDTLYDRSNSYDFFSISKDLEPPGVLVESKKYKYRFNAVDKPNETYSGIHVRLRYFIRLTIMRNYGSSIVKEQDFVVQNIGIPPEVNNTIKMEVGIEDCLHIEFEYDKSKYHLRDVVVGKVYFVLVRIKIKDMQIDIIRTETAGTGSSAVTDSETLTKFEIMDGAPIRSECIPVRVYLSGFDFTPTYKNVQNKFSVRYFLNLVLIDEEDRRYFKKQEITMWRKKIG